MTRICPHRVFGLARLLFIDQNSAPKILRYLLQLWQSQATLVVLNCRAVSGREGTSAPALVRLLLIGHVASHVMVPGVIPSEQPISPANTGGCVRLATCPLVRDLCQQLKPRFYLEGLTTMNQLAETHTSIKFSLYLS